MKINISRGKYVLAVSGGVDSMVLLDLLVKQANSLQQRAKSSTSSIELVVAHFNHGVRADSAEDEKLVVQTAKKHSLSIEVGHGKLGSEVSEDQARTVRYSFLESVAKKYKAKRIITAHHQDDLIETALINMLRGTGRTGLSAIRNSKVCRPLLDIPKSEILAYAKRNKIQWREDSTNSNTRYLRNYIRTKVIPRLSKDKKAEIINNLDKVAKINKIIDKEIATLSHLYHENQISRQVYTMLPAQIGEELLMSWLRQNKLGNFDKKTIKRLSVIIKTGKQGSEHEVMNGRKLRLTAKSANLI